MFNFKEILPLEQSLVRIAALYCTCFNAPEKGEDWTQESAEAYFRARIAEGSVFAGVEGAGGGLIAVCCGGPYERSFLAQDLERDYPGHFYISLVAVDEGARGRGLGLFMVNEFCAMAAARGFTGAIVRCRAENAPMLSVLGRAGFEEIERYTAELGGVTCERVVLRKVF